MYRLISTIFLLCVIQSLYANDNSYAEEDWLREGVSHQLGKFKRMTFVPHPGQNDVLALSAERTVAWSDILRVCHHTGDKIDWIATLPTEYNENAGSHVLSFQWCYLDKLQMWILEVFDSTHMGNGSLWLLALEDQKMRVLLYTRAVDSHHEHAQRGQPPTAAASEVFRGGRLSTEYRVPRGAQYEAVFLTGTIVTLDDNDKQLSTKRYAETWRWDSLKRVFTRVRPQA